MVLKKWPSLQLLNVAQVKDQSVVLQMPDKSIKELPCGMVVWAAVSLLLVFISFSLNTWQIRDAFYREIKEGKLPKTSLQNCPTSRRIGVVSLLMVCCIVLLPQIV